MTFSAKHKTFDLDEWQQPYSPPQLVLIQQILIIHMSDYKTGMMG